MNFLDAAVLFAAASFGGVGSEAVVLGMRGSNAPGVCSMGTEGGGRCITKRTTTQQVASLGAAVDKSEEACGPCAIHVSAPLSA